MTAQSIVCGACSAEVPYGRLSCPSCGELLASVAGSRRNAAAVAAATAARPATPDVPYEPLAAPATAIVDGQLSLESSTRHLAGSTSNGSTGGHATNGTVDASVADDQGAASSLLDDEDDAVPSWTPPSTRVPWGTAADLQGGRTPAYMPRPGTRPPAAPAPAATVSAAAFGLTAASAPAEEDAWPTEEPRWPADRSEPHRVADLPAPSLADHAPAGSAPAPAPAEEPDLDVLFPPPPAVSHDPAPTSTEHVPWPDAAAPSWPVNAPAAWPEPAVAAASATLAVAPQPVQAFAGPGAYVPPAPVVAAGPSAPAREWAGHGPETGSGSEAARDSAPKADSDMQARLLEFVKWLSVAGAAFAAVGFLLPWGQVVIGSGDTGYFGRWGIAGPWHLLVALAILADLGLALIDNKVPAWIRTGIVGLGLGSLLLGLVWPYLTLPALGAGPGAIIAAIGAAGLVVSGIIALVTDRHAEGPSPV